MLETSHWQNQRLGRLPPEDGWLRWALQSCLPSLGVALSSQPLTREQRVRASPRPVFSNLLPHFLLVMQIGSS